ncbi:MAG: hypothetical protein ABSF29_13560 [Tepidisphaeraceae bacterium]
MNRIRSFTSTLVCSLALALLSACAADRMSNIPGNATVASSGNDHLSYTAPSYGTIWVYDVSNDRIDYSGPVSMNEAVSVDPGSNSVTVNGRIVADKVDQGAQHRIYFVPSQETPAAYSN